MKKKLPINTKSLYVKWILLFTGLIILAQMLTLGIVFRFIIPDFVDTLAEKLYGEAEFVRNLSKQGFELTDDIVEELERADIRFEVYGAEELPAVLSGHNLPPDTISRISDYEIISSYIMHGSIKTPCYFVRVGDRVAMFDFNETERDELPQFVEGFRSALFISSVIGSIFIVIAVIVIIRPIRKVSEATREVAKGNFEIRLKTKSKDEIGLLINNFNLMSLELQKNEYLRKDFVSSVSHEFKTPITSIEGFARLLRNENISRGQIEEYTDIIIKETLRLSNLSANLLRLSLLDSSAFEPKKTEFYLDEQIRNVILLLESQWEEKNLSLDIEMEEILFHGSEELLSHVWINVIQNAIKFSPEGEEIGVTLSRENETVTVSVTNRGGEIPPEDGDKIFRRFYKADKSRSKEGNGLGLSIAKRVVEMSKGTIRFESNHTLGTVFYITLPDIRDETPDRTPDI